MLQRLKYGLQRFMMGRNGIDTLGWVALGLGMVFENLRFTGLFRRLKARLTDRDHRYFACPQCGQTVRVPRGKGTIKIRCPKCRTQFEKKS